MSVSSTVSLGQEAKAPAVHEQEILTPIPVKLEVAAETKAAHVFAIYKTWGSEGWRDVELTREGQTWSGEISCHEVSTVTGDAHFYLVALDAKGKLVTSSGTPTTPHPTRIVSQLEGAIQVRCADPSDCPTDFPGAGCPVHPRKRSSCDTDKECGKFATCAWDGYCLSKEAAAIPDSDLASAVAVVGARFKNR